jgi:hypothetical protein
MKTMILAYLLIVSDGTNVVLIKPFPDEGFCELFKEMIIDKQNSDPVNPNNPRLYGGCIKAQTKIYY